MSLLLTAENRLSQPVIARSISDLWGVRMDMGPATFHDQTYLSQFTPAHFKSYANNIASARSALESYSPSLIETLDLRVIKFADQLVHKPDNTHSQDYPISGCVDFASGTMYVLADSETEDTIHHEIGHLLLERSNPQLFDDFYDSLDRINQQYQLTYQPRNVYGSSRLQGFANSLAALDEEEDIPETLTMLMTAPFELLTDAKDDKALAKKIDLTFRILSILSKGEMSLEWQQSVRNLQRFSFVSLLTNRNLVYT